MTQTLPPQTDTRIVRSDRCRGDGGWRVDAEHWTACEGCCSCRPDRYRAPAKVSEWKTRQVFAPADIEF